MPQKNENEEGILFDVTIELLNSKKKLARSVHCYACGEQMNVGVLLICNGCLDEECELYKENSENLLEDLVVLADEKDCVECDVSDSLIESLKPKE